MQVWGPDMPLLESTPRAAAAAGALAFGTAGFLALQYSIPKCGQHPMPISAPPWLPGGPYHGCHPSHISENGDWFGSLAQEWSWWPPLVLFQLGGISPPSQVAPQGGQNVSSGLFHLFRPTGQWARQPFEHIYLMEEPPNLLPGSPIPHKLDSRNICLRSSLGRPCQ